jgi:nitroreductase
MIGHIEAINIRSSIRNYSKEKLDSNLIEKINELLSTPKIGPFDNKPRFVLIEKPKAREQEKVRLGTYGFIDNAAYFIGGCIEKSAFSEVDYGYSLQRIIIELTRLGLGTCWLGGSFRRKDYRKLLNTQKNEIIPCITPVGYKSTKKSRRERLGLVFSDGSLRKDFNTFFFENNFETPIIFNPEDNYHKALEAVRKAPSAMNKQPWRVLKIEDKYHFYLKRDSIVGTTKASDLQKVDMGIALANFKLALEELNVQGKWHIADPNIGNLEYIITWIS